MADKLAGNMLIAQSGGPTMVINQSLVGAVMEARKHPAIKGIYGSLHAIQGVLDGNFVDMRKESPANLEKVAVTPSSALGSARKKPSADDCRKIFANLAEFNVRYFFYIGGNDSAEAAHIISEEAKKARYDFRCIHIPKTIDNDLRENDHTPGFASAARFVACAFMGDNLDNRALPGVKIDVVMGRHAGFLTAASALARIHPGDGPHLIYLPERTFSFDRFIADVQKVYARDKRCVIAVSEGIADENGEAIASKFSKEVDSHGNKQLSGTGALGDVLAAEIRGKTQITRVRADTFGYLQRSFPGMVSDVDAREAREVGIEAVKLAVSGIESGSVAIRRKPGKNYRAYYECVPLRNVAKETRHVPDSFITASGNDVTPAFLDYIRPLVGRLPAVGRLKAVRLGRK